MRSKSLWRATQMITVILLAPAPRVLAQDPAPAVHLSGLISDYTPVSGVGGPWEMRGEWSLNLKGDSGKGTFSASMNMTHSDYWVMLNPGAADDNSAMTGRHPHTHLITVSNATITTLPGGGFELSGAVFVTADGSAAPFMTKCSNLTPCKLTIDVVGGNVLPLSNITMTFSGPPTSHFGTQAIHGFIRMSN